MADISERNHRMKLTSLSIEKNELFKNYDHQIFVYEKGRIVRYYIDNEGVVNNDEFVYLHAKRREFTVGNIEDEFYILSDMLLPKGDEEITEELIKKFSGFVSTEYEKKELQKYNTTYLFKRGMRKCKKVVKRLLP